MATRKRLTITFYPPMDTMAWAHGPSKQWLGNSVETPRRKPNKVVSSCRNWLRNSSAAVVESPEIYGTSVVANPMVLEFLKRDDWTHVPNQAENVVSKAWKNHGTSSRTRCAWERWTSQHVFGMVVEQGWTSTFRPQNKWAIMRQNIMTADSVNIYAIFWNFRLRNLF